MLFPVCAAFSRNAICLYHSCFFPAHSSKQTIPFSLRLQKQDLLSLIRRWKDNEKVQECSWWLWWIQDWHFPRCLSVCFPMALAGYQDKPQSFIYPHNEVGRSWGRYKPPVLQDLCETFLNATCLLISSRKWERTVHGDRRLLSQHNRHRRKVPNPLAC